MATFSRRSVPAMAAVLLLLVLDAPAQAWSAPTTRVNVASDGTQANSDVCPPPSPEPSPPVCQEPEVSALAANGRFVAFQSATTNLVPQDTNNKSDVFVHDRLTGTTTRVSVSSRGRQANGDSWGPSISGDGRVVSFISVADNLVAHDSNGCSDPTTFTFCTDVFVHDLRTGQTARANVSSSGAQSDPDPGYVTATISADGRYVAFTASASNLVPGDVNGGEDVFVRDRVARTTTVVSVGPDGLPADTSAGGGRPEISANGRFVAFATGSSLVPVDTDGLFDIYLRDRRRATTILVSVPPGDEGFSDFFRPFQSPDGRFVVFSGGFPTSAYIYDGVASRTSLLASDASGWAVSGLGRFVAFTSERSDLVPGDTNSATDVFVRDQRTGALRRVSVSSSGAQANSSSFDTDLSANGRFVSFLSTATNLVPRDTNNATDVFLRGPLLVS
jgi:hypothetical protein